MSLYIITLVKVVSINQFNYLPSSIVVDLLELRNHTSFSGVKVVNNPLVYIKTIATFSLDSFPCRKTSHQNCIAVVTALAPASHENPVNGSSKTKQ